MSRSGVKWRNVGDNMFLGEYKHNLDAKGRITIPAKFREDLGDKLIITRGLDECLAIYTPEQMQEIYQQIRKLPNTSKLARQYTRTLTGRASNCDIDSQGRILIPSVLMKEANLTKECVFVGVADHVELWSKEIWDNYYQEASDSFEEIAEQITEFIR